MSQRKKFLLKAGLIFILVFPFMIHSAPSKKRPSKKKKSKPSVVRKLEKPKKPEKPVNQSPPPPFEETNIPQIRQNIWQLKASFGLNRWHGLGFWSGVGGSYVPFSRPNIRLGTEANILLISKGSLSSVLVSAELAAGEGNFLKDVASFGVVVGPGFSTAELSEDSTILVLMGQGAWTEKISEAVRMQWLLRFGKSGSEWAIQAGINLFFSLP